MVVTRVESHLVGLSSGVAAWQASSQETEALWRDARKAGTEQMSVGL